MRGPANSLTKKAPYKGLGAESEEKQEPASDIDTGLVDGLKVLDPERPIREAAVGKRKRPRGGGLSLALDGSFEVRAQGRSWGGEAQGEHFVSTDPRDTLPALCFNRVSWSAEMVSS